MNRYAACLILLAGLAGIAWSQDEALIDRGQPGLLVCCYELEGDVRQIPELVADELPNVVRILPTLNLGAAPDDFAGITPPALTHVSGSLSIQVPGRHRFRLLSDDGARLRIDGRTIIDHDGLHGAVPKDGELELSVGIHALEIWHFDAGGDRSLQLQWSPPDAAADEWAPIPTGLITHDPAQRPPTAGGKKGWIPPLRRGLPGDGTPVAGLHPSYKLLDAPAPAPMQAVPKRDRLHVIAPHVPPAEDKPYAWLPPSEGGGDLGRIVPIGATEDLNYYLVSVGQTVYRLVGDMWAPFTGQGCVLRHSEGASDPRRLAPAGQFVFELAAVRALPNGFELQFTQPLDPRVGWDPESYLVEQWPYVLAAGAGPRRPAAATAVRSASVDPERRRVFLETDALHPPCVVYLRLLPPFISEGGARPWSTEAWYTLNDVPPRAPGKVLPPPPAPPANVLTDDEKRAGWQLLFDGQSLAGWRGFKSSGTPPAGWEVRNGCLARVGPGGDLMSEAQFGDFELLLEWRISAGGNSGIFFRVDADLNWPWESGPEMQVLDNAEHADGRNPRTSAGSNYALHAPARDVTQPVGLFNQVRILVRGAHVEHWLNGEQIVTYELGSPEWEALVAASKFREMPQYGRVARGHIVLQDHGDRVWYRNIKMRPLDPP